MNPNKAFRQALSTFGPDDFSILTATHHPLDRPPRIPTGFAEASASWDKYRPVPQREVEVVATLPNKDMSRLGYQVIPTKGYGSVSYFEPGKAVSTIKGILGGTTPSSVQRAPHEVGPAELGLYVGMPQPISVGGPMLPPVFASKKTLYPVHGTTETTPLVDGTFAVNTQSPETIVGGYYNASARRSPLPSSHLPKDAPPVQSTGNSYVDIINAMDTDPSAKAKAKALYEQSAAFRETYHHLKGGAPAGRYAKQAPPSNQPPATASTSDPTPVVEEASPWYMNPYAQVGMAGTGGLGLAGLAALAMSQPREEEEFYSSPGYGAMPRSFSMA